MVISPPLPVHAEITAQTGSSARRKSHETVSVAVSAWISRGNSASRLRHRALLYSEGRLHCPGGDLGQAGHPASIGMAGGRLQRARRVVRGGLRRAEASRSRPVAARTSEPHL